METEGSKSFQSKLHTRIKVLFRQGLTHRELALSITLGVFIGLIPLFGISTIAISAIAIYLRLNLPLAVFMTYAVSPFHLLLFVPFIRMGEIILSQNQAILTIVSISESFRTDYFSAITSMFLHLSHGLVGWLVIGVPGAIFLYLIIRATLTLNQHTGSKNGVKKNLCEKLMIL